MSNTKKIKVVNITFYNFLSRIVFFAFVFVANVYTSRVLAPTEFGKLQYINFSIAILWTFFNLGGAATLQRFYAHAFRHNNSLQLSQLNRFAKGMILLSISVACTAWYFYSAYTGRPVKGLLYIYLISLISANYLQVLAQATFRFAQLAVGYTVIPMIALTLLWYYLPQYGMDVYILIFTGVNLANALWSLMVLLTAKTEKTSGDAVSEKLEWRVLIRNSAALALSSALAAVLWQRTELYFIRRTAGFDELAVYGVALSLLALLVELFRMLPGAMMPYFSAHKDHPEQNANAYYAFMRYYGWLLVFAFLYVGVEAPRIVGFIYTSTYSYSAELLRIMLWGYAFGALSFVATQLHIGLGKNKYLLIQDIVAAVLVITLCYTIIPVYYISGAAWIKSSVVAYMGIASIAYTIFRIGYHFPVRYLSLSLLCAAVVIFLLRNWMNDSLLMFCLKSFLAFSLYLVLCTTVGVVEKKMLQRIRNKILG
jgi:O-antigen/teichoic acid export membrane protein